MKKLMGILLVIAGTGTVAMAQGDYKNAIGMRVAPESYYDLFTVSYKTFAGDAGAFELNAGIGSRGYNYHDNAYHPFSLSASGTYQHHFETKLAGFKWFVGGGLTVYQAFSGSKNYRGFGFGFYPTGGVDYKFPLIPLNLSADYRPTILVTRPDNYDSFHATNFGISARYVIGR
ncbi:MAG: hypothetical protein M9933_04605 [Chitinophagaceae bacterium]|nr:hypothetical protein [Chitinophagaceae bacterium]